MLQKLFLPLCACALVSNAWPAECPIQIPKEGSKQTLLVTAFGDEKGRRADLAGLPLQTTAVWNHEELVLGLGSGAHQSSGADGKWEVFLATPPSLLDRWQIVISSGSSGPVGESIRAFPPKGGSDFRVARSEKGAIELHIPWASLDAKPAVGQRLRLQFQYSEVSGTGRQVFRWFPSNESWLEPTCAFDVELATKASPTVDLYAAVTQENLCRIFVDVAAPSNSVGQKISVLRNQQAIGSGTLETRDGAAGARIVLPFPKWNERDQPLVVQSARGSYGLAPLRPVEDVVQDKLQRSLLRFLPFVFKGDKFPNADLEQPTEFEALYGAYRIETTFYDAARQQVSKAQIPGRYGAVSRIITASGREFVRYTTLVRQPNDTPFWAWKIGGKLEIRDALGIPNVVLEQESAAVDDVIRERMIDAFHRDRDWPVLLSGLMERDPGAGKAAYWDDAFARDRAWWLPLKLELYRRTAVPFSGPRALQGEPAPTLCEGTPSEVGVNSDAIAGLERLLEAWTKDSGEALTVCLARSGTVFFHKAFGTREDRPASTDDPCFMASITKLFAATAVMMLVQDNRLDLDADIATYLPPLRGLPVSRPATLRHLLTHTAGMGEHSGDKLSDFPERVADWYATLPIGRRFQYNGDSYELAGKILELESGEIIPAFQKRHLLDPLGMTHTQIRNMSGGTYSTAMDIARFGQMFLNGGVYGSWRFLDQSSLEAMKPRKLTSLLGASTDKVWGLGMMPFDDEPLGAGVMGHGAASGAILRIDPKRGLVVVMARNAPGKNYEPRKADFLKAVAGLLPPK